MTEYKIKYKISSLFIIILIVLVLGGAVFVNWYYLQTTTSKLSPAPTLKTPVEEIELLNRVKKTVLDNPEYKQLVPATGIVVDLPEPTVKANPFQTIDQKEPQE